MVQPIILVAGARPNFMKLAPVQRALSDRYGNVITVHTGQHYDHNMSEVFFEELDIPVPNVHLEVGSGSHATQTSRIMTSFEKLCFELLPNLVVVFGDVNSTIACSLVAAKMEIPVAHVESGLRSGDRKMPEEINRIVTDHLSSLLFTTTRFASKNLELEGINREKILLVGNVMIDTLIQQTDSIDNSDIMNRMGLKAGKFDLITLHRPSNVDDRDRLSLLLSKISDIRNLKEIIFPAHPRTLNKINEFDLVEETRGFNIIPSLGYHDFSKLMKNSNSVWTDSGGIQEECTFYHIPCFTLRENTERPETIELGTNSLVSVEDNFSEIYNKNIRRKSENIPFWDGKAAHRISDEILRFLERET